MSKDGRFDPVALKVPKESWISLKAPKFVRSNDQILTRQCVLGHLASARRTDRPGRGT